MKKLLLLPLLLAFAHAHAASSVMVQMCPSVADNAALSACPNNQIVCGTPTTNSAITRYGNGNVQTWTSWAEIPPTGLVNVCAGTAPAVWTLKSATGIVIPPIVGGAGTASATITCVPPTQFTNGTPITGTVSYALFQGLAAGGESTTPVQTGLASCSAVVAGLTPDTNYFFKMEASDAGVNSSYSNEVSYTPPVVTVTLTPNAPTNLVVTRVVVTQTAAH